MGYAIAAGVVGVAGALASSDAAKSGADSAAEAQIAGAAANAASQEKMYNQTRSDQLPYMDAGLNAMTNLTGQQWGAGKPVYDQYGNRTTFTGEEALTSESGLKGHITLVNSKGESKPGYVVGLDGGEHWKRIDSPEFSDAQRKEIAAAQEMRGQPATEEGWVEGGEKRDYQAAAKNALAEYGKLDPNTGLPDTNFAKDIDPMAGQMDINLGLGNRPDLPNDVNVDLDESDPITMWLRDQAAKGVNKGLMARGKYDSRAGVNALYDADMGVLAGEVDRQYNRGVDEYNRDYGREMDMYGINYNEGNTKYARGTDQADKKFTRTYGMGVDKYNRDMGQNDTLWNRNQGQQWNMFNALNSLGGQEYNQDLDLIKIGQGSAGTTGAAALTTGQGIGNAYQNAGTAQANNFLSQGNTNANLYSGMASVPGNMMANSYYMNAMNQTQPTQQSSPVAAYSSQPQYNQPW